MAEARTFRIRFDRQHRITFDDERHQMTIRRRRDPVRENTVIQMSRTLADGTMVDPDAVRLLGQNLYELLFFNGHANEWFERVYESADDLRVILEFHPQASRLLAFPWEFLFAPKERWRQGGKYLLAQARVSLVRRIVRVSTESRPIHRPRFLVVDCLPGPRRGVGDQGGAGAPAHTDGLIGFLQPLGEVRRLRFPGHLDLLEEMERFAPDVVHLTGHGRVEGEGGGFEFCLDPGREPGGERWARDERIAEALGARTPELVLLHTCKGAATDRYERYEGAAVTLVNRGVPNVVAMQHEIQIGEANRFFTGFYEALVRGFPLELAVKEGRQSVRSTTVAAFGLPVVYAQRPEGFALPRTAPDSRRSVPESSPHRPVRSEDARRAAGFGSTAVPATEGVGAGRPDEPGADPAGTDAQPRRGGQESPVSVRFGLRGNGG
jgi:hypothetical protein